MYDKTQEKSTVGVILAGGRAARMGQRDKPLLQLNGRPLIQYVIDNAARQTNSLVISVNRNLDAYRPLALPLLPDNEDMPQGPLAGICTALGWYIDEGLPADHLACFPADVPCFPDDIVAQLHNYEAHSIRSSHGPSPVTWCQTGSQPQPLFSLWPRCVYRALIEALATGIHGPKLFFERYPNRCLTLPQARDAMFLNINTPADLQRAQDLYDKVSPA